MITSKLKFRQKPKKDDLLSIRSIVTSTGFFTHPEIEIAVELIGERLNKGIDSGYFFLFCDFDNQTIGYTCFGPIPATSASYDLYWIAVHENWRGHGVGKLLMKKSEKIIKKLGGYRIYIETSGRDLYKPTHAFYLSCGYEQEALLEDFYAPGDAKTIYVKTV